MKPARIKNKRYAASTVLRWTGMLALANRIVPRSLTVFGCHRIRRDANRARFDDGVFDAPPPEHFEAMMKTLKQNGDAVSERDILDSLSGRTKLPKRGFLVTFDDGYEDCHSIVTPILKSLSIPGLFFIPTEAIDEGKLGWWDLLAWLLKNTRRASISVRDRVYRLPLEREQALGEFKAVMKLSHESKNRSLVEEVSRACEVELPDRAICSRELLTWDQIREMRAAGMSIGSHTHTHRVLATLDLETQRQELRRSKDKLESELRERILSISYPVGGYEHFNAETKNLAQENGYELAFSYHTGVNDPAALDAFDLKRMAAPHRTNELIATLALPSLFGRRACTLSHPNSVKDLT